MYLQEIIEVAIGLIFAWLLLSIAVLQIQEIIASITKKRARDLETTIGNMLKDETFLTRLYDHPLIQSLMEPITEKKANLLQKIELKERTKVSLSLLDKYRKWAYKDKPSYIPAQVFATALFDIVAKAGTKDSHILGVLPDFREKVEQLKKGDQETANALISYLVNLGQAYAGTQIQEFKNHLKEEMIVKLYELEKVGTDKTSNKPLAGTVGILVSYLKNDRVDELAFLLGSIEPYLTQVRRKALTHSSKQLGIALNSLLAGVDEFATDTDKAIAVGRKNVEMWFDSTMERLTGWYKQWAQIWAFFIALAIAISFNVDTIHIAQQLWKNPALRQASTVYIEDFVKQKTADGTNLSETELAQLQTDLKNLSFPIGWGEAQKEPHQSVILFAFLKAFGWLLTAGAAMQGAPFWFDTLKKLVNIRSTGVNPAEKSK